MKTYYSDSSRILMISTSKIHGSGYMEYLLDEVADFLGDRNELLFIPYARPDGISYDEYTRYPREVLKKKGIKVIGIHELPDPKKAIQEAQAIFVGGGNTFLLTKTLYDLDLIDTLRSAISGGIPYMGSSAGSNITGLTIGTTNDMPIIYPPSFEALAFVPFNINPHYLDPDPDSKHQGETRATRIKEFHFQNSQPVIGLREGSWLRLENSTLELKGPHSAPLFEANKETRELDQGDVSFLLQA